MSPTHPDRTGKTVAIWLANGEPVRLVHEGRRYRVSDMPTRLEDENPDHAYRLGLTGWRFQGTDEDGLSLMFVIRRTGDEWRLIKTYD